jgi:hypothetical protein
MSTQAKILFRFILALTALTLFAFAGCGDDDDDSGGDSEAPTDDDVDDDLDDDADDDADDDTQPECDAGEQKCDDQALDILVCSEAGQWGISVRCMEDQGRLCENAACVDHWLYDSPGFDSCVMDPHATVLGLAEKAAWYDEVASRLHIHPEHKRIHNVTIPDGITEETGTWWDVINWHTGENDGLWTGLYITSQAFRYAVTGDDDALAVLGVMMDGMLIGTRITGVPGLFTREYIDPGIAGMECPADPMEYVPDVEKDDNQWVKVDGDGAIITYDPTSEQWVRSDHFVPFQYAGWCWLDNVSQDEYAGHMLALGSVYMLVDDEEIRGIAAQLLAEVADHLMQNDMALVDWDGRETEHGRFWPLALTDFPGFNAIMGLNYIKMGAVASGRQDLLDYYDDCLLQKNGPNDCLDRYLTPPVSFADWLWLSGFYIGRDGCKSNWNNISMGFCNIFTLIWYEWEIELRRQLQDVLENSMFNYRDSAREMANQHNAAWSVIHASMKDTGPESSGPDIAAVNDAICALRQFPESKSMPELHVGEDDYPTDESCESRFDGRYLTFDPVPVYQQCPSTFVWWGNPFAHENCTENPQHIKQPADYLLPYWMGRYFGYIDESW